MIPLIANVSRPRYCLGRNVGTENVLTVTKKLIVVAKGARLQAVSFRCEEQQTRRARLPTVSSLNGGHIRQLELSGNGHDQSHYFRTNVTRSSLVLVLPCSGPAQSHELHSFSAETRNHGAEGTETQGTP